MYIEPYLMRNMGPQCTRDDLEAPAKASPSSVFLDRLCAEVEPSGPLWLRFRVSSNLVPVTHIVSCNPDLRAARIPKMDPP